MAAIDKTYFKTWEQYKSVLDFLKANNVYDGNSVKDEYGNDINFDEIMSRWTKSEVEQRIKEYDGCIDLQLWNTPTYIDIWLIRNCDIDFIVDRLKFQYGDSYEEIKEHRSDYDRPRMPGCDKFSVIIDRPKDVSEKTIWTIGVESSNGCASFTYDKDSDSWHNWTEPLNISHDIYLYVKGDITYDYIKEKVSKWDLPAGTVIYAEVIGYGDGKMTIKIG